MNAEFGAERGATPVGNRESLEAIAREVNEREKKLWEQKMKAKQEADKLKTNQQGN